MPIHNSMDALAAAALSFGKDEGPRLVNSLFLGILSVILINRFGF